MPSITRVSSVSAIASVDSVTSLINAGGAGRIDIMDGAMPASVDDNVTTQNVLASLGLSIDAFQDATDQTNIAQAIANPISQDPSAALAGTATWFRAYSGAGAAIIDGNIGTVDESMIISNINIAVNDTVSISSWAFSQSEI